MTVTSNTPIEVAKTSTKLRRKMSWASGFRPIEMMPERTAACSMIPAITKPVKRAPKPISTRSGDKSLPAIELPRLTRKVGTMALKRSFEAE